MDLSQIIILALIQGITEFLPISSSAHLILIPKLIGWQDQGLLFDVALHVGTLTAVISYFFQDIKKIISAGFSSIIAYKINPKTLNPTAKLFFALGFATVPVGVAGLLLNDFIELNLRSIIVIAISSIVFGLVLLLSEKISHKNRDEYSLKWFDIMLIGFAQALALIPGTSRSGATITAGLLVGLTRKAAARFSFLLSIPVIFLGGLLKIIELFNNPISLDMGLLAIAVGISFVTALLCIHYFLKLLDTIGMLPFVIYRVILGGILLVVYYYIP